ncbi:MAG: hypothetical protein ACOC58_00120 [Chloroflexota bacterium]
MVFNPMSFATPQQKQHLETMQQFTKSIKYIVHTEDNRVEFRLETDDPDAAQLIDQLLEGIVTSTTQMLYQMFEMQGERV